MLRYTHIACLVICFYAVYVSVLRYTHIVCLVSMLYMCVSFLQLHSLFTPKQTNFLLHPHLLYVFPLQTATKITTSNTLFEIQIFDFIWIQQVFNEFPSNFKIYLNKTPAYWKGNAKSALRTICTPLYSCAAVNIEMCHVQFSSRTFRNGAVLVYKTAWLTSRKNVNLILKNYKL